MNDLPANKLKFYGFPERQWGNEGSYAQPLAFFEEGDSIVYRPGPPGSQLRSVKPGEEEFLLRVEEEVYGDPATDVVVITGDDFADSLDLFDVSHDIREWNKALDVFYWKVMPLEQCRQDRKKFGEVTYDWLVDHILTGGELDPVRIKEAVSFLHIYGLNTQQEWVISTTASQLINDESEKFNDIFAVDNKSNGKSSFAFKNVAEFRKAVKAFQKEYHLEDRLEEAKVAYPQ